MRMSGVWRLAPLALMVAGCAAAPLKVEKVFVPGSPPQAVTLHQVSWALPGPAPVTCLPSPPASSLAAQDCRLEGAYVAENFPLSMRPQALETAIKQQAQARGERVMADLQLQVMEVGLNVEAPAEGRARMTTRYIDVNAALVRSDSHAVLWSKRLRFEDTSGGDSRSADHGLTARSQRFVTRLVKTLGRDGMN